MKKIKKETIKIIFRRKYIKYTKKIRKKFIKNKDFTIISNNCWAGFIYQSYDLPYNTPTIGMFMVSDDFIKFISNLKHYMSIDKFIEVDPIKSKWYKELKNKENFGKYPIAILDDIELHLLHYKNIKDAEEKWNKRKKRINYEKILFKFSDMNYCNEKNLNEFQQMKLPNKICFVSNKYKKYANEYTFVVSKRKCDLLASQEPFGNSRIVNINSYINNIK